MENNTDKNEFNFENESMASAILFGFLIFLTLSSIFVAISVASYLDCLILFIINGLVAASWFKGLQTFKYRKELNMRLIDLKVNDVKNKSTTPF